MSEDKPFIRRTLTEDDAMSSPVSYTPSPPASPRQGDILRSAVPMRLSRHSYPYDSPRSSYAGSPVSSSSQVWVSGRTVLEDTEEPRETSGDEDDEENRSLESFGSDFGSDAESRPHQEQDEVKMVRLVCIKPPQRSIKKDRGNANVRRIFHPFHLLPNLG